jgi:hypothetical protein
VLTAGALAAGEVPGWLALPHPAVGAAAALIASAASPGLQILTMTSCGVAASAR